MHVCYLYGLPAIPTVMQRARLPDDAIWYPKAPILALPNYEPALGTAEHFLPHDGREEGVKTQQDIGTVTQAKTNSDPTAAH